MTRAVPQGRDAAPSPSAIGRIGLHGPWPLLVAVAALTLAVGCRAKKIWAGIEFRDNGTVHLAADEPMCGCLSVINITSDLVRLRATLKSEVVGEARVRPAERQRFRFDWAGGGENDYYEIEVFGPGGRIDARKALEAEDRPRWVECDAASCEFGDLHMGIAAGER